MIDLDHNATTPLLPDVLAGMMSWFRAGNPSSSHARGRAAAMAVDVARQRVADLAGWQRDGVIFTSGATEANALAVSRGRWAVSAVEHPSVLAWGEVVLPVLESGIVDLDRVTDLIDGNSLVGVSVQLANNETGVIQPIAALAELVHGKGLPLHVDAAQAPGRIELSSLCTADSVALSAHKIGGPQGVGALLIRPGQLPYPTLRGGPQERGWRAGTHNVAGIVGFGQAAAIAAGAQASPALRDALQSAALNLGGRVAGAGSDRLPNTLSVGFEGVEAADLVVALDLAGICASAGAACASGSPKPSHVLRAMSFAGSAVRFSLGRETTETEISAAIAALRVAVEQIRACA